jgi:anti-sigma B factor antagonist
MEVKIEKTGEDLTVKFIGRLDTAASQEIAPQMNALKGEASGNIILDFSQMTYISSSGLRIILTIRKDAAANGGRVVVHGMNDGIRSVFMMTGFLNLFEIE